MSKRLRAGIAGVVGAVVALGMAELLHGLFDPVPSVFTSLAQGVVRLTPGVLVTEGIETLGTADIPTSVEVSTDGGESWNDATLAAPLDVNSGRQYLYDWDASPGQYTLQVRATDGTGRTQTGVQTPPHPSGATGYHTVDVTVA